MLASILVVHAFLSLRRMLGTHEDVLRKVKAIERRVLNPTNGGWPRA